MNWKKLLLAFSVLFAACGLFADEKVVPGEWTEDYKAALKTAKEKNMPVLVNFTGSDWCGWCVRLDKEVFSRKDFQKYAKKNLILLKIDFPRSRKQSDELKKQNEKLAGKFGIRGFPTILILDEDGKVLAQTGYQPGGAKNYVKHLKKLIKDAK